MAQNPRLLVVDDDSEIRDLLGKFLSQHGFDVKLANGGEQMFHHLNTNQQPDQQSFDLIILDLMMPGDDGLTLCRKVRNDSNIPIIMLTAVGEDVDRIVGLEMGADDYIPKPFNPRELLARIRAILRRRDVITEQQSNTADTNALAHSVYQFNDWKLDKTSRTLLSPDGTEISISGGEFDLLLALVEHPQHVLSRDHLLDITKNRQAGPFDRSIDIQISRLRRKIEDNPKSPTIIKTVRGGGYVLSCAVSKTQQEV